MGRMSVTATVPTMIANANKAAAPTIAPCGRSRTVLRRGSIPSLRIACPPQRAAAYSKRQSHILAPPTGLATQAGHVASDPASGAPGIVDWPKALQGQFGCPLTLSPETAQPSTVSRLDRHALFQTQDE